MAKLHEILAVSASKTGQTQKVLQDLTATFTSKLHLFTEKLTTFTPLTEGAATVTEEALTLNSTVNKELEWAAKHVAEQIDVGHRINLANRVAASDIVLEDDTIVVPSVPATTLLEVEKRLAEFKDLLKVAPTLDPAKGFTPDPTKGDGKSVYKARPVKKQRTAKRVEWKIIVPATKEHAAQAKEIVEDVPVGTIHQDEWSGCLTPARKVELLERVENLLRAVKAARSRANEEAVPNQKIGQSLVDYILA